MQAQKAIKDHCSDNSKAFALKSFASLFAQDFKPFDKARKDNKKKQWKNKPDFNLVTRVNPIKVDDNKKKKKNVSKITCYNHNQKRHYSTRYSESWKPKN